MPFEPKYMTNFDEFIADKAKVRSLSDWSVFNKKWFNHQDWPILTSEQRSTKSKFKNGPIQLGGRSWGFTYFPYDLSPEARYEYAVTVADLGSMSGMPEAGSPKVGEQGWLQECPFCEIVTDEMGDETCPRCARRLICLRVSD